MKYGIIVEPLNKWVISFQYVILFSSVVNYACDVFVLN